MKTVIITQNMILESKRRSELELLEEAKCALENGMFIDQDGEEKNFAWSTREAVGVV